MSISAMFDMSGKVAVVTGSTKGIGKSIAEQMAAAGAKVVVSSRKPDACDAVAADINANWAQGEGKAIAIACHAGRKEQLQQMVDRTIAEWGRIDSLVLNAAVNPYIGPLSGLPDSAFDKVMETNVKAAIWACNMVCPQMAELGGGSIIIISSIGGVRGGTELGTYAISKAADMQLARNLAVEWGPKNIRANSIAPGLVKTDFARALWEDPKRYEEAVAYYPMRRLGDPEDISGMVVALASDAGKFLTGQTILVDGGSSIMGR